MDDEDDIPRLFGAYHGVVVDNVDPEGRYRCRLEVVGITTRSAWAYPFGTSGGGSPQRGGFVVPAIGADVIVFFLGGDIERPIYTPAWWSTRDGQSEMPIPARDVPPASAHLVQSLQLGDLVLSVDERPGQRQLAIEDRQTGDAIVWDLEKQGLRIKMTSAVDIQCDGLIRQNAAQVTVQNRLVAISPKPI